MKQLLSSLKKLLLIVVFVALTIGTFAQTTPAYDSTYRPKTYPNKVAEFKSQSHYHH